MPQQLFGEIDDKFRIVICDMEAGVGTIVRNGRADTVIVVAEPSVKSIDVARRAAGAAAAQGAEVMIVGNRVRDEADAAAIGAQLGEHEIVLVPEEPAIARADEEGRAPIDFDPTAPGVKVLLELADRLGGHLVPAQRPSAPPGT